jgi:hypothetical protein
VDLGLDSFGDSMSLLGRDSGTCDLAACTSVHDFKRFGCQEVLELLVGEVVGVLLDLLPVNGGTSGLEHVVEARLNLAE